MKFFQHRRQCSARVPDSFEDYSPCPQMELVKEQRRIPSRYLQGLSLLQSFTLFGITYLSRASISSPLFLSSDSYTLSEQFPGQSWRLPVSLRIAQGLSHLWGPWWRTRRNQTPRPALRAYTSLAQGMSRLPVPAGTRHRYLSPTDAGTCTQVTGTSVPWMSHGYRYQFWGHRYLSQVSMDIYQLYHIFFCSHSIKINVFLSYICSMYSSIQSYLLLWSPILSYMC